MSVRLALFDAAGNKIALMYAASNLSFARNAGPQIRQVFDNHCSGHDVSEIYGVITREGGGWQAEFWNPDGTYEKVCGNAMRCIPSFLFSSDLETETPSCLSVSTRAGAFKVYSPSSGIGAMTMARSAIRVQKVTSGLLVDPGTPHLVQFVTDLDEPSVAARGEVISNGARPLNATFVTRRRDDLYLRTFERGVGETRSCGTGAISAFIACEHSEVLSSGSQAATRVTFRSGEHLDVQLAGKDDSISLLGRISLLRSATVLQKTAWPLAPVQYGLSRP
jgi:diaminopimelate epimerase